MLIVEPRRLEEEARKTGDFTTLQAQCGSGLWKSQGVERLRFPKVGDEHVDEWWDESALGKVADGALSCVN